MGNMVLVAVRHSDLENTASQDFETVSRMMHDFETVHPKLFDGSHLPKTRNLHEHYKESYTGNILFSGYYHASDCCNLVVTNEMMAYFPAFIDFYREAKKLAEKGEENKNLEDYFSRKAVREAKKVAQFDFCKMKLTATKSTSKKWTEKTEGDSFSLFGFLTDNLHNINPETALKDIVDMAQKMSYMDNGAVYYGDSMNSINKIIPLGNFKPNQKVMVSMNGNLFSFTATTNYGEDIEGIKQKIKARDDSGERYMENAFPEICKSFKYNVKITPN